MVQLLYGASFYAHVHVALSVLFGQMCILKAYMSGVDQRPAGPLVFPHEMQTAEDAVRLQLNAMRDMHIPRYNHGLQVCMQGLNARLCRCLCP